MIAILSNPRSGKSLLLQVLARRFTKASKQPAVCITYNSYTQFNADEAASPAVARRHFYARLFVEIAFVHGVVEQKESKELQQMVIEFDMNYAKFTKVLKTLGLPMPKLVCIDEFSTIVEAFRKKQNSELADFLSFVTDWITGGAKVVFSGFATQDAVSVQSASGRSVEPNFLQPVLMPGANVLEGFRARFGPLRAALMRIALSKKVDFNDASLPPFVSEPTQPDHLLAPLLPYVLQSCPGHLGHILENKAAPPLLHTLRNLPQDDVASSRRQILLAELREDGMASGSDFEKEQRVGLALPVAGGYVVVHPFGFFVTVCQTAFKKHEDPFERHLAELVRRLSSLAQEIHVKSQTLFAAPENTVEWAKADGEVEAAELDFMGAAVYYARAMPALGGGTAASSLDLDPECTLHLPAPLFGAGDDGMPPRAGARTHRVSVEEALMRAEAVGARLGGLERCGVRRFVWRLVRAFNAVADVVEGELTAKGWALRLTAAQLGGAAEVAEQKLQLLAESLTVVPWPFGRETEVASVELVLLCPAGGADLRAGRLAEDAGLPKAHGRGVAVQVKATAAEVRAYITTAIAAVIPSGGQR